MVGMVGRDDGAFAGPVDELPAVAVFQVVVEAAQRVELVQLGVLGARPRFAVVELDAGPGAALDAATG